MALWRRTVARGLHSSPRKGKAAPLQERKIVDRFFLRVRGGHGGAGSSSYRKGRHARYGRVDGGDGGLGGNVLLKATSDLFDFRNLRHVVAAADGSSGTSKNQIGKRGKDEIVRVPLGTVVHLCEGTLPLSSALPRDRMKLGKVSVLVEESDEANEDSEAHDEEEHEDEAALGSQERDLDDDEDDSEDEELRNGRSLRRVVQSNVVELLVEGSTFLVAEGGSGGRGNTTSARGYEPGRPKASNGAGDSGTEAVLVLELKSIADIGLVGAPNVGKSSLLGAISKAKPNVGDYSFTTLRPNIGRVEYEDFHALSVADIPGLITGAHQDKGLGFDFLRHVERTKAFAYVLDVSRGIGHNPGAYAWEQLRDLMYEMECYKPGMTKRPSLIVANKVDEEGAERIVEELRKRVSLPVYPTCAILEEGVVELKEGLRNILERVQEHTTDAEPATDAGP